MAQTSREFFVDSVSSTQVQLARVPGRTNSPDADAGLSLHRITIITGNAAAANASTAFWQANCQRYLVTVVRLT